jgi:dipeptidyl aminopeptidase/acylaminoacyl peptidase
MSKVQISDSGQHLAWVNTSGELQHLIIAEVSGKPIVNQDLGDLKLRRLEWAGDDYLVAFLSSTQKLNFSLGLNKDELWNMVVVGIKDGSVRWPLANKRVVNAAFGDYGLRKVNGRWSAYVGTYEKTDLDDNSLHVDLAPRRLTRVDLDTSELTTVDAGRRGGGNWLLDVQGNVIASSTYDDDRHLWVLYAGAHADRKLVESTDKLASAEIWGQGTLPGTIVYSYKGEEGASHLMQVPLAGGDAQEILSGAHAETLLFDRSSRLAIGFTALEDGHTVVSMFDASRQARIDLVKRTYKSLAAELEDWSSDFKVFIVRTEGRGDSGTWWLLDLASMKGAKIGFAYPGIRIDQVGDYRWYQYKAADGMELDGVLTLPPGPLEKNLPVVVLPHGGPAAYDRPGFDWWAQAFASRGYAVWQPNYRGSEREDRPDLQKAGFGQWGRKMQTDVSDGLAALARDGIVDPGRACIVGGSYGGYAALAGVTLQQHVYRCAVSVAGVADMKLMIGDDSKSTMAYWLRYLGAKSYHDDVLDAYSPALQARQANAPVLLIHGKDDTVVPFEQSTRMRRALESAGKQVSFVQMEGEDHWLSRRATRVAMLEAAVGFVIKYNPPGPAH